MAKLTDLASLKRAFYRMMDTDPEDPALTEHDEASEEAVEQLLDHGLWDAQDWMIRKGLAERWVKTVDFPNWGSGADSDWQGADSTDGGQYAVLPDDFLRLAGDEQQSALREPNGDRWGRFIDWYNRDRAQGDFYWLQGNDLWIAEGADPPSDLQLDYHYRAPALTDGTDADFPVEVRPLIVAFAADRAVSESWPMGSERAGKVERILMKLKLRARKYGRRSRQPHQLRPTRTIGSHWFI